jgi:hypothetical protein
MGCVLKFNGKDFNSQQELENYLIENKSELKILSENFFNKKEAISEQEIMNGILDDLDAYEDMLVKDTEDFLDRNNIKEQRKALQVREGAFPEEILSAIEFMSKEFDAVVIPGKLSQGVIGELLPADHPLALKNKKPVIILDPAKAKTETVYHEFGHLYIDLLKGSENELVAQAFDELKDTDIYNEIKERYAEEDLSEEYLLRETLVTVMGRGAAISMGKETLKASTLNNLIQKIYEAIAKIFKKDVSAVEKLTSQLIGKSKIQKTLVEEYNSIISQKQIETENLDTFEKVVAFCRKSKEQIRPVVEGGIRFYQHKGMQDENGLPTTVGITHKSGTNLVHNEIGKYKDAIDNKKVFSYNIDFKESEWPISSFRSLKGVNLIPVSLNNALETFFKERGFFKEDETSNNKSNWLKVLQDQYALEHAKKIKFGERRDSVGALTTLSKEDVDKYLSGLMTDDSGAKPGETGDVFGSIEEKALAEKIKAEKESVDNEELTTETEEKALQALLSEDGYKRVIALANAFQEMKDAPSVGGNITHEALEQFVKNPNKIPEEVEFKDDLLLDEIKKIRFRNGENADPSKRSQFFTEISFYDPINKIPITIDLLEIDYEGKFRIYDYKGKRELESKYRPKDETPEQRKFRLFFQTNYVHQLMLYGSVLENLGMKPAKDTFSLLMYKMEYNPKKNKKPAVSQLEVYTWSRQLSIMGGGLSKALYYVQKDISSFLRNRQGKIKETKSSESAYAELRDSFSGKIALLEKIIRSNKGGLSINELKEVKKKILEIAKDKNKLDTEKLKLHIEEIVNGVLEQTIRLENIFSNNNNRSMEDSDLFSFKYILQAAELLEPLLEVVRSDKSNDLNFEDKYAVETNIVNIMANVSSSKRYYLSQIRMKAAERLAESSNFQVGVYKRKKEMELLNEVRKGKPMTNAQIDAAINKYLISKTDEIEQKEFEYWLDKINNGYIDLRFLEYYIADPGISKSQFIQVGKRMIDKADTKTKRERNISVSNIVRWEKTLFNRGEKNTERAWRFAQESRVVKDLEGNDLVLPSVSVIPEYTSGYREFIVAHMNQKDYYVSEYLKAKELRISKKLKDKSQKELDIIELLKKGKEDFKEKMNSMTEKQAKEFKTLRKSPIFEALNDKQKEAIRVIHKQLREDDKRVDKQKYKLVKIFYDNNWKNRTSEEYERIDEGEGAFIYNIPRKRMGEAEALGRGDIMKRYYSSIRDGFTPAADRDDLSMPGMDEQRAFDQELDSLDIDDAFNQSDSDLENNELYELSVPYRNDLREDSVVQSWDIPTLLVENASATIEYANKREIEPDLFMVMEALKNGNPLKTDMLHSGKVEGANGEARKSESNLVAKAFKIMVDDRMYRRRYSGVYSKGTYVAMNAINTLKKFTSMNTLAGNYMSMLTTTTSGSIYQMIEAGTGEFMDKKGFTYGLSKTMGDFGEMTKDSQRNFAESKTLLMLDMVGLQEFYGAGMVNDFAKKSFLTKNLDTASVFAVTSLGERLVASSLMYAVMHKIKILNKDGDYIDKEGNVVEEKDAMTYDQAFEVKNGVLELNPHAEYTTRNPSQKMQENGVMNDVALTDIHKFVESNYANMFGQYSPNAKSVMNSTVVGGAISSMRNWMPRGINNRYRGISSLTKEGKHAKDRVFNLFENITTFEEINKSEDPDIYFYSQDRNAFQEGYHVTNIRYLGLLIKDLKNSKKLDIMLSSEKIKATMTRTQLYNLTRSRNELLATALTYLLRIGLVSLLSLTDDEEKNSPERQRAYFLAYIATRVSDEFFTFLSVPALAKNLASFGAVTDQAAKLTALAQSIFDIEVTDEDETILSAFGLVYSGTKYTTDDSAGDEDDSKFLKNLKRNIPGYGKVSTMKGILGIAPDDQDAFIEDSYRFYERKN